MRDNERPYPRRDLAGNNPNTPEPRMLKLPINENSHDKRGKREHERK